MKKLLSVMLAVCLIMSCTFILGTVAAGAADDEIVYAYKFNANGRQEYSNGPGSMIYNDNGSVTMTSTHFAAQHQALYNISDTNAFADAMTLANGDDGDGTLCMGVTILKCSQKIDGKEETEKGAEIKIRLIPTTAAAAAGQSEVYVQSWLNYGQTKVFRFGVDGYEASDFRQVYVCAMNYAVNGGAGNFEIVFSPLYATTGEGFEMPEVTIPTVDPSIKTSTFMSFSAIDREDAYGNPPDKVTYDKNGGVTLKSINTKVQHQIAYYFSDKEQTNTALAIANREGGTNTVEITVTVIDAKDINNNTGKVEIQIMLFSNPDVNGYQPANVTVQQWQEVGTSKTYYINVGDYKSYSNCYYVKLCAMNYWYYDESGNLIEHPDWNDGHKYTSAEIAPTVHFSKMIVSEKRYDEVEEIVYGDCNSDGDVNVKDVLALRKYLAKWDVQINMDAADVNVDGKVDTKDVLRLRKFLANWDVELGKA